MLLLEFILDCSHRIVERISQVKDLETLERDMSIYLKEYTGKLFWLNNLNLELYQNTYSQEKTDGPSKEESLSSDNKTLKRAVKILYGKLQYQK